MPQWVAFLKAFFNIFLIIIEFNINIHMYTHCKIVHLLDRGAATGGTGIYPIHFKI